VLGYLTEVNLKTKEVRTTFRKEVRTFYFSDTRFPLVEALKVSVDDMHNQIREFLAELAGQTESQGTDGTQDSD